MQFPFRLVLHETGASDSHSRPGYAAGFEELDVALHKRVVHGDVPAVFLVPARPFEHVDLALGGGLHCLAFEREDVVVELAVLLAPFVTVIFSVRFLEVLVHGRGAGEQYELCLFFAFSWRS